MSNTIPNGVWPTMLTPFTEKNKVDYLALEELVEWYIKMGVNGLFAVCQSSEMVYLSLEERVEIVKFVNDKANGRVPVIASGHISEKMEDQIEEINAVAQTGVEAVVLVSSRIAGKDEPDSVWKRNVMTILDSIPDDIKLGFYECPFPYKRLISPELLKWCAGTGRFGFLKDTSCDIENIRAKLKAVEGTELKIFNANSATLLESLKDGVSGYCGVMANFHPDLYVWMTNNYKKESKKAKELMDFLGMASVIERQLYPVNAKYTLGLERLKLGLNTRSNDVSLFTSANRLENEQLFGLTQKYRMEYLNA